MVTGDEEVQWAYLLSPMFQIENTKGVPATGGWLEVYIHGTRNKYYCAKDFDGTLHPFKIPLDGLGANIVLASPAHAYDVYAYNKYGSLIMSRYNIVPATGEGSIVKDVVTITSNDGTVDVSTSDQTNWDLSIKDTTDQVAQNTSDISDIKDDIDDIKDDIDDINTALDSKKNIQNPYTASGSVTKTITNISQDANGKITVTYSDIDLPAEVPNVNIISTNGTISITSGIDVESNTKTFDIDVKKSNMEYFDGYSGHAHYEDRQPTDVMAYATYVDQWSNYEYHGDFITNNWQATNNVSFILKPGLYLVHAVIRYSMNNTWIDPDNPNPSKSNSDDYIRIATGAYNGLENGTVYKDWSHEYELNENTITMTFVRPVIPDDGSHSYIMGNSTLYFYPYLPYGVNYAMIDHLQIVKLDSIAAENSGGGTEYTAGDAIDITNNTINVKVNPASGIDIVNDELVVKVGSGLTVDPVSGLIIINSEVGDVVETVEKLKKDLDTQITVNFDMPNVTHTYDFANRSVSTLANGACMLCQAFTIPINHEIRVAAIGEDEPTLLGIYAKQQFNYKIMLALYIYDFETGYTDYVGDTGPVYVDAGRNEYPLVHKNPNINELTSSCVYYASLYLPSNSQVNGLYLASCDSYSSASYINATPRFSVGVENITYNNSEIDMTDANTGRLDYNDGQGNYYIGPWTDSYNERPAAPRFFMQVRNGTPTEHYEPSTPFTTLGAAAMVTSSATATNLPNFTPSSNNSCFRDVTPDADCDITYFEWLDDTSSAAGWAQSNCVYNSGFDTNLSGQNNVVSNIGQETTIDGHNVYRHRITFGTAIHLTANTTYRFLCECFTDTSYVFSRSSNTNTIHVTSNGWYADLNNMTRYNNIIGKYLKVCADGTDYEI